MDVIVSCSPIFIYSVNSLDTCVHCFGYEIPKLTYSDVLFCPANSPNPKYINFIIIGSYDIISTQQIFTSDKLDKFQLINNSFSFNPGK